MITGAFVKKKANIRYTVLKNATRIVHARIACEQTDQEVNNNDPKELYQSCLINDLDVLYTMSPSRSVNDDE